MAFKVTFNLFQFLNVYHRTYRILNYCDKKVCLLSPTSSFKIRVNLYCDEVQLGKDAAAGLKLTKKKTVEVVKITLFHDKGQQMSTTIEQATKLAKARNLKLVKVKDATASQKAVYELTSFSKLLEDVPAITSSKTHKKIMAISSKIMEHDLNNKIKNIKRALAKRNYVQVVINKEGSESDIQNIIKKIDLEVKGIGTMDKKITVKNPKFLITPVEIKQDATEITPETNSSM